MGELYNKFYKVVVTFESVDEILKCDLTIQMIVTEQSFLVVLFIVLYQVDSKIIYT